MGYGSDPIGHIDRYLKCATQRWEVSATTLHKPTPLMKANKHSTGRTSAEVLSTFLAVISFINVFQEQ